MRRRLLMLLAVLIGVIAVTRITGRGERLFFWPSRSAFTDPPGVENVTFVSDGLTLHGWFYRGKGAGAGDRLPTIVHCHGNAFNIGRHAVFVDFLPPEGFNVFIFDYRCYGRSDRGPLNREGLIADARAAIDYVLTRPDVDPARVGVYGLSLGGTIGLAAVAEEPRVKAVCSASTFSTWKGVAGDHVPLLGPFLTPPGRDAVDSVRRLGDRPLLIVHGSADRIVPYRHAPIIFEAAKDAGVDVTLKRFDGVGHVDWIDSRPAVREAVIAFFREQL